MPYGVVRLLRSNRTRVELWRRLHYARRRTSPFWLYRISRVVLEFCGIFAVRRHGAAWFMKFAHVTCIVSQNPLHFFSKKINTNFPRPYRPTLLDGAKILPKSATPCTNDTFTRTMPYGAARRTQCERPLTESWVGVLLCLNCCQWQTPV